MVNITVLSIAIGVLRLKKHAKARIVDIGIRKRSAPEVAGAPVSEIGIDGGPVAAECKVGPGHIRIDSKLQVLVNNAILIGGVLLYLHHDPGNAGVKGNGKAEIGPDKATAVITAALETETRLLQAYVGVLVIALANIHLVVPDGAGTSQASAGGYCPNGRIVWPLALSH